MVRLQVITISDLAENNITMQRLELSNNVLQELIMAKKAWQESTKCIDQNTLTDHKPKGIIRYDGTHVNIASFVNRFRLCRKLDMVKTEL